MLEPGPDLSIASLGYPQGHQRDDSGARSLTDKTRKHAATGFCHAF